MLERILPEEIKKCTRNELNVLCDELRRTIYDTVTKCGGHLSSNLGSVESTVAMFHVFDFPNDKVVFDVGHQCYPYKLLSGRFAEFSTLRQKGGVSGFPKRSESVFDCYDTGHAGTSVSAALGFAKARDLLGENHAVIAYIGDGSFNNGLIYEALNSLKVLNTKILIVLNDNGMSISPTVGGMHDILSSAACAEKLDSVRLLEQFGFTYRGIRDGNDLDEMLEAFAEAKELLKDGSVLLHIATKKGKGYVFAEEHPLDTHGVPPMGTGKLEEYSFVLGDTLCEMAEKNEKITVVSAAMKEALGLSDFFVNYPERAFDVGICEEHASVLCSSMAAGGLKPYYAIYSTFLQRAFDEIIHDVCSMKLPVTFCIDRAGISGSDGETHQGVFDISYLSLVPNLTIVAPKDTDEFRRFLQWSENFDMPLAIRYPRAGNVIFEAKAGEIVLGKWEYLRKAKDSNATILAVGERCLILAMGIANELQKDGVEVSVVNARFVKPLDEDLLKTLSGTVVTMEDNVLNGGFGSMVTTFATENNLPVCVKNFAYRDEFIVQGSVGELQSEYGVNAQEIAQYIKNQQKK